MASTIQQSELRNDNAAVMRRVAAGESFVVTVNGRPVADVVPHRRDTGRRRFMPVHELATILAGYPSDDAREWLNDLAATEGELDDTPTDPFDRPAR